MSYDLFTKPCPECGEDVVEPVFGDTVCSECGWCYEDSDYVAPDLLPEDFGEAGPCGEAGTNG